MKYKFDFAYIAEKIIEPIFRKINVIKLLKTAFSPLQKTHDDMFLNYFNQQKEKAQWNSTILSFEYILNQQFNNDNINKIFIQNKLNDDFYFYLFKINENIITGFNEVYLFPDDNVNGQYQYYAPFNVYRKGDIVRRDSTLTVGTIVAELFICINDFPPINSLDNTNFWRKIKYIYTANDILSTIDFVVYIPAELNDNDFDQRIRAFIDKIKLYNQAYTIVYYIV